MATDAIRLEAVLKPEEEKAIDGFGAGNAGVPSLPALSRFLAERFSLELVTDPDIVVGFARDHSHLPGHAAALCRPRTERECVLIFRACFASGVPYTVSAGRTNLTGSATPEGGVVISTAGMVTPEARVDEAAGTVLSPVGVLLEDMRRAVLAQSGGRLMFPVDPTSRAEATVGGAIACNASGFTPGERGAIRHWVEAVEFLLPDGSKVRARRGEYRSAGGRFVLMRGESRREWPVPDHPRPPIKNAGGPFSAPDGAMDFVDLVVGSEGLFGLVTSATLRLQPCPAAYLDLFFSLPEESQAVKFYHYLRASRPGGPGALSAFEYFGVNCRAYMNHESRLFRGGDKVAIYIQEPLTDGSADDAAARWLDFLAGSGCGIDESSILLLDNARDREIFLDARHSLPANSLEVVQRRGTHTIMTDTVVPPGRFAEFLEFTHALIRAEGLDYLAFGHLGDCHLHFMILPEKDQLARGVSVYDRIVAKSAELGGVYSGEHGTGKRKRADFLRCYGPEAVEGMRRCKDAVDPQHLLNRGNVVEYVSA